MTAGLFEPEDQKPLDELVGKTAVGMCDDVIIYAVGDDVYALNDFNGDSVFLFGRPKSTYGFCVHNDTLYDCGDYNQVVESMSGEVIVERDFGINALCSHDGKLYDAGDNNNVFRTFEDKAICGRGNRIWALCSHKGSLYDAGDYYGIWDSFNTVEVSTRGEDTMGMVSFQGSIYDGGRCGGVMKDFDNVYAKCNERESIMGMFVFNNGLYVYGEQSFNYRIFSLPNMDCVHDFKESNGVTSVASVPRHVLEGAV